MSITRLLGVLVLAACALKANAAQVDGLYEAEIEVASQEAEERQSALRQAIAQVLVKLTGDRNIASQAPALIAKPDPYIQQFEYRQAGVELGFAGDEREILWVQFDGAALMEAVTQARLPLWGRNRPQVLVWLAVEERGERRLAAGASLREVQAWMQWRAHQRGLPLILPTDYAQERTGLALAEIWGNFRDPIMKASHRYRADAVLVARVYAAGAGRWRGRWTLYQGDHVEEWESSLASLTELVHGGIDDTADKLAQRFAIVAQADAAMPVKVTVLNIKGIEDYAKVSRYLDGLDAVTAVQVERIEPAQVVFRVAVRGSAEGLNRSISLGRTLAPAPSRQGSSDALYYQYQP